MQKVVNDDEIVKRKWINQRSVWRACLSGTACCENATNDIYFLFDSKMLFGRSLVAHRGQFVNKLYKIRCDCCLSCAVMTCMTTRAKREMLHGEWVRSPLTIYPFDLMKWIKCTFNIYITLQSKNGIRAVSSANPFIPCIRGQFNFVNHFVWCLI